MTKIHVTSPSGLQAEYEAHQLRALHEKNEFEAGSKYWKEGMTEWRPLTEYFSPYASSPMAAAPPEPALDDSKYRYTSDPRKLTSFLLILLWLNVAVGVVSLAGEMAQLNLLSHPYTTAEGEANDLRQSAINLCHLATFLLTSFIFLKWIYRANVNSRGFGAQDMRHTPGWAVGFYFIPFLNLVRPYQAMREIWQISRNPANWQEVESGPVLKLWWTFWLLSNFAGQATSRLSTSANTIDKLHTVTLISIADSVIGLVLCAVAIKLVKAISQGQERLVSAD